MFDPRVDSIISELKRLNQHFCKKVKCCLGISPQGDSNLVLNQQGEWVPTGSGTQVQSDWDETNTSQPSYIKNKPTIPSINGLATETFVTNITDEKVDKVTGKGLSENDYTTAEKNKLNGIQAGAEVNVNADWNATSGDAQILNKPTIPDTSNFALKTEVPLVVFKTITPTVVTGKTVETCIYSIPLPVDGLNYIIEVSSKAQIYLFGGSPISHRLRVGTYLSPIDGASGADAIGNQTVLGYKIESSGVGFPVTRRFKYFGGSTGSIFGINASISINDDNVSNSSSRTLKSADLTTQHYLYVSFNPSTAGGAIVTHLMLTIKVIKI